LLPINQVARGHFFIAQGLTAETAFLAATQYEEQTISDLPN
jgi:hypothetical protein